MKSPCGGVPWEQKTLTWVYCSTSSCERRNNELLWHFEGPHSIFFSLVEKRFIIWAQTSQISLTPPWLRCRWYNFVSAWLNLQRCWKTRRWYAPLYAVRLQLCVFLPDEDNVAWWGWQDQTGKKSNWKQKTLLGGAGIKPKDLRRWFSSSEELLQITWTGLRNDKEGELTEQ